jgi:CMP/dCMP kinase
VIDGRPLQIAIDGPAASGKTTVARGVAQQLHILYLDTGAMYRALAFLAVQMRTDADNGDALARLAQAHPIAVTLDGTAPLGFRIFAGDRELDEKLLQSNDVTAIVSTVAAHPQVREAMVQAQRRVADRVAVVMAGRDVGSVVLPGAPVKVFLTASVQARVARRKAQLEAAGVNVDARRLKEEIEERDRLDSSRKASPLAPAPGAQVIDSSAMGVQEVVNAICLLAAKT